MLDLNVHPEQSLSSEKWDFILGMHFSQAVAIIQNQIGTIRGVQVLYNESVPLETDLVLNLTNDGIQLYFDPVSQRLKVIEVNNMKLVKLKYCGKIFNSPEVVPSIEQIDDSFGATHPGVYDAERQTLAINFPGLTFYFPVDQMFQPASNRGLGHLKFPTGMSPVVSKMFLYSGNNPTDTRAPALPSSCIHNLIHLDNLYVIREMGKTKGLRLNLYTDDGRSRMESRQNFTQTLYFGDSCQMVSGALGAPSRLFFKSEDKMKIHNAHARKATTRSDFFFNYFTLGLDVLFDAKTQCVKKFVLHTNFPGHYNFNMYHRCDFELPISVPRRTDGSSPMLIDIQPTITVQSVSVWNNLEPKLKARGRPVVLHRSSSTNTSNPFGSTFCYAYQDIIFEVMQNGHIASVTLYESEEAA